LHWYSPKGWWGTKNCPTPHQFAAIAVLTALVLASACVSQRPDSCKEVDIASAGEFCLDTPRFVGIAPGAGGLGGTAHYVEISSPSTSDGSFDDVSKIELMADLPLSGEPPCATAPMGFRCIAKVPDKPLMVIVVFDQPGAGRFIERTQALAKDAGDNVIKQWHKK
jgi:hypothetical protein